jgi:hypothetical protein
MLDKINTDFIPIIGELGRSTFVLNIISFTDGDIMVDGEIYRLKMHQCIRCVISHDGKQVFLVISYCGNSHVINVPIPEDPSSRVNVFNCDCQFLPETGAWDEVEGACLSFHLGDQVYLDHIFMELAKEKCLACCTAELTDEIIRSYAYEEYRVGFKRKARVLQSSFNIMLGDDHDIADESLRTMYNKERTEQVVRVFKDVFNEIGGGLRLNKTEVIHYGESSFLLIDNIDVLGPQKYCSNVIDMVGRNTFQKKLYIMSPRVMMNDNISALYQWVYSCDNNTVDYTKLYDALFSLNSSVVVLFGDAHISKRFEVLKAGIPKRIELLFVGTMNSALDPYDGHEYLTAPGYRVNQLSKRSVHSYVTLRGGKLEHVFIDSFLNKCCGVFFYAAEYLCLR